MTAKVINPEHRRYKQIGMLMDSQENEHPVHTIHHFVQFQDSREWELFFGDEVEIGVEEMVN